MAAWALTWVQQHETDDAEEVTIDLDALIATYQRDIDAVRAERDEAHRDLDAVVDELNRERAYIDKQRAEIERLRSALEEISNIHTDAADAKLIARAALAKDKEGGG